MTILCGMPRCQKGGIYIVAIKENCKDEKGRCGWAGWVLRPISTVYHELQPKVKIPLRFHSQMSGFMVGGKAEHGGIIKDGPK